MKIRGHGNAISISLAALAVVIAGTGTAVAVTSSTVNIADPVTPSHVARIDSSGRLTTIGVTSTLNSVAYVAPSNTVVMTGVTTATLAITRVAYDNPAGNLGRTDTNFYVTLKKINVGASGSCTGTDANLAATISQQATTANVSSENDYAAPLIVKATGSTPYCIVATSAVYGTLPDGYYYPYVQLSAYVAGGTYTGVGTNAAPSTLSGPARSAH